MSSSVQAVLTTIQQNDYSTLILLTAITYDYILTFSKEIEYVWNKPWTSVSTLFVLVRYCGICFVLIYSLMGSTFLPGPTKTCLILANVGNWAQIFFTGAADLVMILRVWAVYQRSRWILGILLALYISDAIIHVVVCAIYSAPTGMTASTLQMRDMSLCSLNFPTLTLTEAADVLSPTLGAIQFVLMIYKFTRESIQMYRATKQWQLNRYMNLFLKEGIMYFLLILLYNLSAGLLAWGIIPVTGWKGLVPSLIQYLTAVTLLPRFVVSIRELYARDMQGRRGSKIDTGFGLSAPSPGEVSDMMFAETPQRNGLEEDREVMAEETGGESSGAGGVA